MATGNVNLDTTQYVRANSGLNALMLQAHRDSVRVVMSDTQPVIGNSSFHLLGGDDPILNVPSTDTNVWVLAVSNTSSLTVTETNSASLSHSFLLEVAKGNKPGHSLIGFQMQGSISTTVADIWAGSADLIYPTAAETWEVVSDNVNDTSAGTGGRDGIILSLDANGLDQVTPFTLNGTTPVVVANTHLRPRQIILLNAGSTGENLGRIELRVSGGGDVRNVINPGKGLSMDGHFTVPYDSTAFLIQSFSLIGKDLSATAFRQLKDSTSGTPVWLTSGDIPLYQNIITFEILAQFPIASATDMRLRASTTTGTGSITIIDELLMVKNSFL